MFNKFNSYSHLYGPLSARHKNPEDGENSSEAPPAKAKPIKFGTIVSQPSSVIPERHKKKTQVESEPQITQEDRIFIILNEIDESADKDAKSYVPPRTFGKASIIGEQNIENFYLVDLKTRDGAEVADNNGNVLLKEIKSDFGSTSSLKWQLNNKIKNIVYRIVSFPADLPNLESPKAQNILIKYTKEERAKLKKLNSESPDVEIYKKQDSLRPNRGWSTIKGLIDYNTSSPRSFIIKDAKSLEELEAWADVFESAIKTALSAVREEEKSRISQVSRFSGIKAAPNKTIGVVTTPEQELDISNILDKIKDDKGADRVSRDRVIKTTIELLTVAGNEDERDEVTSKLKSGDEKLKFFNEYLSIKKSASSDPEREAELKSYRAEWRRDRESLMEIEDNLKDKREKLEDLKKTKAKDELELVFLKDTFAAGQLVAGEVREAALEYKNPTELFSEHSVSQHEASLREVSREYKEATLDIYSLSKDDGIVDLFKKYPEIRTITESELSKFSGVLRKKLTEITLSNLKKLLELKNRERALLYIKVRLEKNLADAKSALTADKKAVSEKEDELEDISKSCAEVVSDIDNLHSDADMISLFRDFPELESIKESELDLITGALRKGLSAVTINNLKKLLYLKGKELELFYKKGTLKKIIDGQKAFLAIPGLEARLSPINKKIKKAEEEIEKDNVAYATLSSHAGGLNTAIENIEAAELIATKFDEVKLALNTAIVIELSSAQSEIEVQINVYKEFVKDRLKELKENYTDEELKNDESVEDFCKRSQICASEIAKILNERNRRPAIMRAVRDYPTYSYLLGYGNVPPADLADIRLGASQRAFIPIKYQTSRRAQLLAPTAYYRMSKEEIKASRSGKKEEGAEVLVSSIGGYAESEEAESEIAESDLYKEGVSVEADIERETLEIRLEAAIGVAGDIYTAVFNIADNRCRAWKEAEASFKKSRAGTGEKRKQSEEEEDSIKLASTFKERADSIIQKYKPVLELNEIIEIFNDTISPSMNQSDLSDSSQRQKLSELIYLQMAEPYIFRSTAIDESSPEVAETRKKARVLFYALVNKLLTSREAGTGNAAASVSPLSESDLTGFLSSLNELLAALSPAQSLPQVFFNPDLLDTEDISRMRYQLEVDKDTLDNIILAGGIFSLAANEIFKQPPPATSMSSSEGLDKLLEELNYIKDAYVTNMELHQFILPRTPAKVNEDLKKLLDADCYLEESARNLYKSETKLDINFGTKSTQIKNADGSIKNLNRYETLFSLETNLKKLLSYFTFGLIGEEYFTLIDLTPAKPTDLSELLSQAKSARVAADIENIDVISINKKALASSRDRAGEPGGYVIYVKREIPRNKKTREELQDHDFFLRRLLEDVILNPKIDPDTNIYKFSVDLIIKELAENLYVNARNIVSSQKTYAAATELVTALWPTVIEAATENFLEKTPWVDEDTRKSSVKIRPHTSYKKDKDSPTGYTKEPGVLKGFEISSSNTDEPARASIMGYLNRAVRFKIEQMREEAVKNYIVADVEEQVTETSLAKGKKGKIAQIERVATERVLKQRDFDTDLKDKENMEEILDILRQYVEFKQKPDRVDIETGIHIRAYSDEPKTDYTGSYVYRGATDEEKSASKIKLEKAKEAYGIVKFYEPSAGQRLPSVLEEGGNRDVTVGGEEWLDIPLEDIRAHEKTLEQPESLLGSNIQTQREEQEKEVESLDEPSDKTKIDDIIFTVMKEKYSENEQARKRGLLAFAVFRAQTLNKLTPEEVLKDEDIIQQAFDADVKFDSKQQVQRLFDAFRKNLEEVSRRLYPESFRTKAELQAVIDAKKPEVKVEKPAKFGDAAKASEAGDRKPDEGVPKIYLIPRPTGPDAAYDIETFNAYIAATQEAFDEDFASPEPAEAASALLVFLDNALESAYTDDKDVSDFRQLIVKLSEDLEVKANQLSKIRDKEEKKKVFAETLRFLGSPAISGTNEGAPKTFADIVYRVICYPDMDRTYVGANLRVLIKSLYDSGLNKGRLRGIGSNLGELIYGENIEIPEKTLIYPGMPSDRKSLRVSNPPESNPYTYLLSLNPAALYNRNRRS
jgi:hypothetical protein